MKTRMIMDWNKNTTRNYRIFSVLQMLLTNLEFLKFAFNLKFDDIFFSNDRIFLKSFNYGS